MSRVNQGPLALTAQDNVAVRTGPFVQGLRVSVSVVMAGLVFYVIHLAIMGHMGRIVRRHASAPMVAFAIVLMARANVYQAFSHHSVKTYVTVPILAWNVPRSVNADMAEFVPTWMVHVRAQEAGWVYFANGRVTRADGV